MLFKKINLASTYRNKLKKENKKILNRKFIEDESFTYLEKNKTPRPKREIQDYDEFIKHMGDYLKLEENNKKSYYNKIKKNIQNNLKETNKNQQRIQYDININKKIKLLEENKSFANFNKLQNNYFSFLIEDKNKPNELSNINNKYNTRYKRINIKTFNNFNNNTQNIIKHNNTIKLLESINSANKFNIIRKKIHLNKINYNILETPKKLFKLKLSNIIQKNSAKNETNINNNTNNKNSFESNSLNTLEQNNRTNYIKKPIVNDSKNLKLYGKKLKWENKPKIKKPFSFNKILAKYNNRYFNNYFNNKVNLEEKIKNYQKKNVKDFQNNFTVSTDRQDDNIIKPIRLKNFNEWKNDM